MKASILTKILDVLLALVICFAVIVALLWFVHTFNVFKLPGFVIKFFDGDSVSIDVQDTFETDLLTLIESQSYMEGEYEYVRLTGEKAHDLLSSFAPVNNYYWEVETTVTSGAENRVQNHRIYKRGEDVRIDTVDNDSDLTTVYSDNGAVTVDNKNGGKILFENGNGFSYTDIINVSTLEKALSPDNYSIDTVAVVELEDKKYLYLEIPKSGVNGVDKFFVSLDNGIVLYSSSEINGTEYFKQNTVVFDSESVISDNAFDVNYSKEGAPLMLQ